MLQKLKDIYKTEQFLVTFMFRCSTINSVFFLLIRGSEEIIPLISIWLWKLIIDKLSVVSQTGASDYLIWLLLSLFLSLQVLLSIFTNIKGIIYGKLERKARYKLDSYIMNKMSELSTDFFDSPENRDMLEAAQMSETYVAGNMVWFIETIIKIFAFLSGIAMFLSYHPLLGLIYLMTYIPGTLISYKYKQRIDQWSIDNIPSNRKKEYYKSLLTQKIYAKEVRLYNLADFFKKRYNDLWNQIRQERTILFKRESIAFFFASLVAYAGLIAIISISVHSVITGTMMLGTLVMYIGLAESSGGNFKQIVEDLAVQWSISVPRVKGYIKFLSYGDEADEKGSNKVFQISEVEFRNVFFKYPNSENYVLNGLNFKISFDKKIALVGINGAGKTTIVKLLLRFYKPDAGEILVNGKNIEQYDLEEWHRLFSVCFQDVNMYALTLRENICLSDVERMKNTEEIQETLKYSGIENIYKELPSGLETDLTRQFNEQGVEFSGGQWQKIAIARAFFKKSRFIILDEPSSALDPEAEDFIFKSFRSLCKDRGGILISHRLSSIMMVDEIVYIEKGKVIESGTHAELIKKNGEYAKLYSMQAKKYKGD